MSKINEILSSIILYLVLSYIFNLPNTEYGLLLSVLGSQIDLLFPLNYRHTLINYIPLSILAMAYPAYMMPIMIGYTASIFINLLSKDGCKLLYPVRETTFTGPKNYLENNTKEDYAATAFLITLAAITLLLSFNGTEILDDLSEDNSLNNYFTSDKTGYNTTPEAVQYININPAYCVNKNITTTKSENTTTTVITEYQKGG